MSVKGNLKLLFEIFAVFFKISPVSFGGGFAMIPILELEIADKKKWIKREKLADVFTISQTVPGAVAVNSAIFLGYQLAGTAGAVAAMLGMVIPTFIIIIILGTLFISFQHNVFVQAALKGVRPVVVALILAAAWKMRKNTLIDKITYCIFAFTFIVLCFFQNISLILVILFGAMAGIAAAAFRGRLAKLKKGGM